ncbi:MAG TPA: substrate-binding domain-containing protein [Pirellulales bacterium]|nr:substrate-binding domain-containing protein [Pirellulales bacterium]
MLCHLKLCCCLFFALAAALSAGCAKTEEVPRKRILLLTNGDSPYWDACRQGLQAAAADLKTTEAGYTVLMEVNSRYEQGQIDMLRQYASQSDVVAVGISVYNATNAAVADEMRKLRAKGVHVLAVDNDVDRAKFRDARFAFIGTDNLEAGSELGVAIRNLRPDGGEIVTFVGSPGAQNALERVEGVEQGAGEKFKLVDNMSDQFDRSKSRENVRNAISNHPDVNVLVGIYSYNGPDLVDVVRRLNRRSDFTLVTFDAEPTSLVDMAHGELDCMIVQDPYKIGYESVKLMKALVEDDQETVRTMLPHKNEADGDIIGTGLKMVVPDMSSPLKAEMFKSTTEFMTFSHFKRWLAEYKLRGS